MRKFTIGCSTRNSQIINAMNPMAAPNASHRIKFEESQSASCPLSSIICRHPIQIASNAKPIKSIRPGRISLR